MGFDTKKKAWVRVSICHISHVALDKCLPCLTAGKAEVGRREDTCPKSHSQGLMEQKFRPKFSITGIGKTEWNKYPCLCYDCFCLGVLIFLFLIQEEGEEK